MTQQSINPLLIQAFSQLITKRTGLEIKTHDWGALCQKILLRTKESQKQFPETYYQLLTSKTPESRQEWRQLIPHLTNPESFFFRDKGQLSVLRKYILPELSQRKDKTKKLRICSAGCSTGEEPYSIAILLQELIPDLDQWDVKIFGIDLNPESINKAQVGSYGSWSMRGVEEYQKQNYFHLINDQYQINPLIKRLVSFQALNLVDDPLILNPEAPASSTLEKLDLIICRNVFIYFESVAITKVVEKFYNSLQPLGYFLAGHSELYGQDLKQFKLRNLPESLVLQRPETPPLVTPEVVTNNTSNEREKNAVAKPASIATISPGKLMRQAQILLQKKSFVPALELVQQALKIRPDDPKAYCLMAEIYIKLNNRKTAIHYCHKALTVDEFFVSAYYILARIATTQGKISAAKRTLKKIIYLEPTAVVAYLELSKIYQQEGDLKKSERLRELAMEIFQKHLPKSD